MRTSSAHSSLSHSQISGTAVVSSKRCERAEATMRSFRERTSSRRGTGAGESLAGDGFVDRTGQRIAAASDRERILEVDELARRRLAHNEELFRSVNEQVEALH